MKTFIETERLFMREIVEEDVHDMFELDNNVNVHKYLGNNPVQNLEKSKKIIEDIRGQYERNGIGRWAVIKKGSNEFLGWSGLKYEDHDINDKQGYYDIGYRFKEQYWGKGYATECAVASLEYGFTKMNWDKICAAAQIANVGSNKVLQKIGLKFIEEFDYRNTACNWYELTKAEWQKQQLSI